MRGPFGTNWGLADAVARDLIIVAGGVGLAPLRPVVLGALADRDRFGSVTLIAGARSRDDFLFSEELQRWTHHDNIDVHLTVDVPVQGWPGEVGFVTEPLRRLPLRPERTTAFLCGPEPMMRNGARELLRKGMAAGDIRVSLERNMQCGIGWCGHCQLGPLLLCRDGPVVGYDIAEPLLVVKEL
jgi:NAD(P)H-flavin reductase